ncbi:MAG: hypothetical protein IJD60_08590 [Clostridia bacterium]|nr:hypothetical protein [Clostridia bacterium]
MINASFDAALGRRASISRIYQYDTGQRLRLHGLPSQGELTEMDELVYDPALGQESRPAVASVLVQYGYEWDEKTEDRTALPEADGTWIAEIPDEYLTRTDPVHLYVHVFHGERTADAGGEEMLIMRGRTLYEGVFTPIARPAPNNIATPEQIAQWESRTGANGDVTLVLADAKAAAERAAAAKERALAAAAALDRENEDVAEKPITEALQAAQDADRARETLAEVTDGWDALLVETEKLAPGAAPTAAVSMEGRKKKLTFGLPQGETGDKGEKGDTGPADITITSEVMGTADAPTIRLTIVTK